jgi:uncharacterized protein
MQQLYIKPGGMKMEYKELGKSKLRVSLVGFGGIPLQRITKLEAKEVLVKAEELGINFIDTARGYTISENYIGEALKGRRDKWIIATKSMARDCVSMFRDIETSLKNLQTDYIDLYQLHNVRTKEEYDKVFGKDGAYQALERAKSEGRIGHIGITSHSADILEEAVENTAVETIMYPYNIIETQANELFRRAAELDIGVIAMKPLAGGMLNDGALAMKFILNNKDITTAIPGMASIEEVEQNVSTVCNQYTLTPAERAKILKVSEELGTEFCRRCGYCAPCPEGIDIPTMFLLLGYKKRYNLSDWAKDRYFSAKKRAKHCKSCGSCEKRCPYNLPIRRMMDEVKEMFDDPS